MRFLRDLKLTVICGVSLFVNAAVAQTQNASLETTPSTLDFLSRFEQRFEVLDSVVFGDAPFRVNTAFYDSTFVQFSPSNRVEEIDRVVEREISEMINRTGLDVRGQVYVRPGSGVNYDPDDPLVAYNAKAQAELEWNIFNSSIYKRASKARELKLKGELRQLDYVRDDLDEQILLLKQQLRVLHYGRMLSVVNCHIENVRLLMETQMYLLEHGKISGDDLLKLINEQSELERRLISIAADSIVRALPAHATATYITLTDTAGIMASINENNVELKKLNLRYDLLEAQIKNTDYLQTMDIMPFVRFAYYNRPNAHNTHNLDAGVSFKIPITAQTKKKRNTLRAEQNVIKYEQDVMETETTKGILLTFHDLEIYNENVRGEFNRMQNLRKFLSMRKESYSNVDGEYSRIGRLVEYNAYLQAWERLLEYSYRRDCLLIDLQKYLLTEPITKYISFNQLY